MNLEPDPQNTGTGSASPSLGRTAAWNVAGMFLLLLGVAAIVGGIVLHFAEKADRFVLFPFAGRLIILAGIALSGVAMVVAGAKATARFGAFTLLVGILMFVYGYANLANPDQRFYAPLGFFVGLAGGLLLWGGLEFAKEQVQEAQGDGQSGLSP